MIEGKIDPIAASLPQPPLPKLKLKISSSDSKSSVETANVVKPLKINLGKPSSSSGEAGETTGKPINKNEEEEIELGEVVKPKTALPKVPVVGGSEKTSPIPPKVTNPNQPLTGFPSQPQKPKM